VNQPIKLSRTPNTMQRPTPDAGEHTDEVLRDLGYDAATIADLRARKVV
jgi:formyl-CoA transferase